MQRLRVIGSRVAIAFAFFGSIAFLVGKSDAELENQVFTSRADRLRLVVPRGWRASDQPSYPGLLLWLSRSQPPGQIVLTSETFTRELYCSWPITCRAAQDALTAKFACALRSKLEGLKLRVGTAQPSFKDPDPAAVQTVAFEYEDKRRFLRQAVAIVNDRAVSLVLAAPSNDARAAHVRQFDQTLRTLRIVTPAEAANATTDGGTALVVDGGALADASTLPVDGAVLDAGAMFESTTTTRVQPVGPCATTP